MTESKIDFIIAKVCTCSLDVRFSVLSNSFFLSVSVKSTA